MTEKIKILIGDNSAECGLTWASLLKNEGMFTATRAKNGKVILDQFAEVLSDVAVIEKPAKFEGRSMIMFLAQKR